MSFRARPSGLNACIARKIAGKRDPQKEAEAQAWIVELIGEKFPEGVAYEDALKDGVILCKLINVLVPGSVKRINAQKMPFKQMENIGNFLTAVQGYGVPASDLFQTVDLYERRNIPAVTQCFFAMGRVAQTKPDYYGPMFGPKPSEENIRLFTEEQMMEGRKAVSLQMGSNKFANQSGLNFGVRRQVT
ncbi:myophilin-like isoform X2 [Branchiostoma floridae]|uniref:Transgelin n=1 Tax=Branchiostoma floridae TaxID=7739 RepID=A0A9J7LQV0_BRAFL|nr:myophilin-like isoform X1 [Branchiostoma floridae]XP_035687418.1 myophilin-like isoform X2 [Branchiostoma floridae]